MAEKTAKAAEEEARCGFGPPLGGVKVLDLSRYIAGPHCGMLLGDLGADVVKVERPAGDDVRHLPPFADGESLYLLAMNRNKRGIVLDLRDDGDQERLRELSQVADVLIENFRPGTMEKMGCGWERLHELNPRLVMVRISGFGQTGPYADRPAFDQILQAMAGLMEMTGQPDGPPTVAGTFVVDYLSALHATIAIQAALAQRELAREGQLIDVSLLDCAASVLTTAIPEYLLQGREMRRNGNRDRYGAPESAYPTRDDGWVFIAAGSDPLFERLAEVLDLPELKGDPRFSSAESRVAHADELDAIVAEWMRTMSAAQVVATMERAGIPCAKVATIREVAENPQLKHRNQIVEMTHPTVGSFPMHGVTVPLKGMAQDGASMRPAPLLGQHTEEVFAEWLRAVAVSSDTAP